MIEILLENKRPVIGEIELTLFENCHLNCSFCHHDKKSEVGITPKEILSKIALVEDHLRKLEGKVNIVQINMVVVEGEEGGRGRSSRAS